MESNDAYNFHYQPLYTPEGLGLCRLYYTVLHNDGSVKDYCDTVPLSEVQNIISNYTH